MLAALQCKVGAWGRAEVEEGAASQSRGSSTSGTQPAATSQLRWQQSSSTNCTVLKNLAIDGKLGRTSVLSHFFPIGGDQFHT